jgi:hypothetical protein
VVYLDDVLIYARTKKELRQRTREILKALLGANFRCKLSKCVFETQKVDFLGYVIEPGKIGMQPDKVKSIIN